MIYAQNFNRSFDLSGYFLAKDGHYSNYVN